MSNRANSKFNQREVNEYEPSPGMWVKAFKGIDDLCGLVDNNPAEWSIAKGCAFFAIGLYTMERFYHILDSL